MSPRDLAARALGVERSDIVDVEPIQHGLTNRSWIVRTRTEAVVVRINSPHWASLQIDRDSEAIVLDTVAAAGIGAPLVARDLQQGVLITRYVGPTCAAEQMRAPEYIDRLGERFRALHALDPPRDARAVHLPTLIDGYLDTLRTLQPQSPLLEPHIRARGLILASEIADTCTPRLCHNDVHYLNVVDAEPLRLIDWEYAGVGEPLFDLASVCVYHDYSMEERDRLLSAYLDAPPDSHRDRLAKCCWLFEYVRDLWSAVRTAIDAQPTGAIRRS
jgi:thiamine kinase